MDSNDIVTVQRRFLYSHHGDRHFLIKGIGFPVPPPLRAPTATPHHLHPKPPGFNYNATAWIAVLRQLRDAVPDKDALNAVRIYSMDPALDYTKFFEAAEEMGFYLLLPLTGSTSGSILNRALSAPECYPPSLYEYGKQAINNYARYPNVLMGVVGNEVMNDLESWHAAPCVKAYARDLQRYMQSDGFTADMHRQKNKSRRIINGKNVPIPLMYATQHSGIGAAMTETDAVRLTIDYFGCQGDGDKETDHDIDILGVNIESWCSSFDSFELNEKGGVGAYYQLFRALFHAVDIPVFFSEMGCSRLLFNKDNQINLASVAGTRDWRQVPVVLKEMNSTFAGFSAYVYSGNSMFYMFGDDQGLPKSWDGRTPLTPTPDFEYFKSELMQDADGAYGPEPSPALLEESDGGIFHQLPMAAGGIMDQYYGELSKNPESRPTCSRVLEVLETSNVKLLDMTDMPSFCERSDASVSRLMVDQGSKIHVASILQDHTVGLSLLFLCTSMVVLLGTVTETFWRRRRQYEMIPESSNR